VDLMDGIADMGGMHGFGPIDRSDDDGTFHAEWERSILGITFSALGAGLFNVDEIRRATESADPLTYLKSTYYERWLYSTEDLLKEKGAVTASERCCLKEEPTRSDRAPSQPIGRCNANGTSQPPLARFLNGTSASSQ
jgi:hypothetical protein